MIAIMKDYFIIGYYKYGLNGKITFINASLVYRTYNNKCYDALLSTFINED